MENIWNETNWTLLIFRAFQKFLSRLVLFHSLAILLSGYILPSELLPSAFRKMASCELCAGYHLDYTCPRASTETTPESKIVKKNWQNSNLIDKSIFFCYCCCWQQFYWWHTCNMQCGHCIFNKYWYLCFNWFLNRYSRKDRIKCSWLLLLIKWPFHTLKGGLRSQANKP